VLSGKNLSSLVNTIASGTAKFNVDAQGMSYQLDVKNIKGVIGAHISLQNGTDLSQVFNPYIEIAGKPEIPTGEVNGQLSKGVLTTRDLSGPLIGKNVTDLTNLMNTGSVYVIVRTQANENGEIQGQVTPSNNTGN
jgi:CHRD domain-containing protein